MARILSISYDRLLLDTRQKILEREGHDVISTEGFVAATRLCEEDASTFDLAVIGHSIPFAEKKALFETIVTSKGPVPIIVIALYGEPQLDGVTAHVDPHDPRAFVQVVREILATTRRD